MRVVNVIFMVQNLTFKNGFLISKPVFVVYEPGRILGGKPVQ